MQPQYLLDAHHHCWIPEQTKPDLGYGWLRDKGAMKPFGDPTPIQRDYLLAEFRAESNIPLLASVHVQCDGGMADPVGETRWVSQAAASAGFPLATIGFVDLCSPDAGQAMNAHGAEASFRGVRHILSHLPHQPAMSFAPRDLLSDEVFHENFALIAQQDCLFEAQLYPEQAPAFAMFLTQQPQTNIVIDHALSPYDHTPHGFALWCEAVHLLAQYPTMAIKLSGFGMFDVHWSAQSIQPWVRHILKEFGAARVMFGSNFPVEKLARTYPETVQKIADATDIQDQQTMNGIFADNAARIYGLDISR